MSVINCLPRNDAAISRDRCNPPLHLPTSHLSPSNPSTFLGPFSFIPLCSSQLCSSRVRSFVRASLARPAPPLSFLSFVLSSFFYFDRQRALVMHLNNLFISDSTLRATRALVIMRRKHSRVWERVGRFLSLGFCVSPSFRASTIDVVEDRNTRIVSRILIKW